MVKKEKETQIALGTYLPLKWQEYLKSYAAGEKFKVEGLKFFDTGDKIRSKGDFCSTIEQDKYHTKGDKLCAEGTLLHAKGDKLQTTGKLIFIEAIIKVYGKNITINWAAHTHCILENGQEFKR